MKNLIIASCWFFLLLQLSSCVVEDCADCKEEFPADTVLVVDTLYSSRLNLKKNSYGQFESPDCKELFPDTTQMSFNLIPAPQGGGVYSFTIQDTCHIDFGVLSKSCECNCFLDEVTIEGMDLEGAQLGIEFGRYDAAQNPPSGWMSFTVSNGQINLPPRLHRKPQELSRVMTGKEFHLFLPQPLTTGAKVKAGGFCIVVNVDGGGN